MKIPELRTESIEAMGETRFRKYLDALARVATAAKRRFLAELPEVERRGWHRSWGYSSIYEYAAKKAGCSKEVVDELLRLHGRIGKYERLWAPLREGVVGWSKLKVVAPFVTPETVGWWAKKVRTCSKRMLQDECARLRAEEAARQAAEDGSGGGSGGRKRARGASRSSGGSGAGRTGAAGAGGAGGSDGNPVPGRAGDPDQNGLFGSGGGGSEDASEDSEDAPPPRPSPRLTVEFDAETWALLETLRLQAEKERKQAVSLGEVVRESVRARALEGSAGAAGPEASPPEGTEETAGVAAGEAGSSGPALEPRSRRSHRGGPISALLVLYRNVDSGELRVATGDGTERVDPANYAKVCAAAETVHFEELKAEVEAKPGRKGSRYLAKAHQKLVAAVSGNRCSFPGCTALAVEWHHVEPVGEGGTSDATNHAPVCLRHHEGAHTGWIEGNRGPVKDWRYVRPGGRQRSQGVDRKWQERRKASAGASG